MSKTPLYKMLQDVPSSGGWTLATLLDGSVSGSQLLFEPTATEKTRDKLQMPPDGGQSAIVIAHNTETLHQRRTAVGRGHPLHQIVGHHLVEVAIVLGMLEHTDAPVVVG